MCSSLHKEVIPLTDNGPRNAQAGHQKEGNRLHTHSLLSQLLDVLTGNTRIPALFTAMGCCEGVTVWLM